MKFTDPYQVISFDAAKRKIFYREDHPVIEGKVVRYDIDGYKSEESNYENGLLHGIQTEWYSEIESKSMEENFSHGKLHGLATYWWPNGTKYKEGSYTNDRKVGVWREWAALDGRMTREVDYGTP